MSRAMSVEAIVGAPRTCCFCLDKLPVHGGNNADPVAPLGSECCNWCNDEFVTPARMKRQ